MSYSENIIARFERQKQKGIKKYGQILEDNPRGPIEALEFLAEELTDGLNYLEELKSKLEEFKTFTEYQTMPISGYDLALIEQFKGMRGLVTIEVKEGGYGCQEYSIVKFDGTCIPTTKRGR